MRNESLVLKQRKKKMDSIRNEMCLMNLERVLNKKISFINEVLEEIDLSHIHSVIGFPTKYMITVGGKRLRPILCSLCAELVGGDYRKTKEAFIALELIHNATLVHDDILDGDQYRRGEPSVSFMFGRKNAVLTGDALFALGLKYAANTKNTSIVKLLSETALKMVQGVALQSYNRRKIVSEEMYYQINYLKSGSLFETATALGAIVGLGNDDIIENIAFFGKEFGNAYQIRDDICNVFYENEQDDFSRNDLVNGDISLPLIYALNSNMIKERDKKVLEDVYKGNKENFSIEEVRRIYLETDAIKNSINKMNEYAQSGYSMLKFHENSEAKDVLEQLINEYYFRFKPGENQNDFL